MKSSEVTSEFQRQFQIIANKVMVEEIMIMHLHRERGSAVDGGGLHKYIAACGSSSAIFVFVFFLFVSFTGRT